MCKFLDNTLCENIIKFVLLGKNKAIFSIYKSINITAVILAHVSVKIEPVEFEN